MIKSILTLCKGSFFLEKNDSLHLLQISRRTNPRKRYTIVEKPTQSTLKPKNTNSICYMLTLLVFLQMENLKKSRKLTSIVRIEESSLHIFEPFDQFQWNFQKNWWYKNWLMKKLMIIFEVTKAGFETLSIKYI